VAAVNQVPIAQHMETSTSHDYFQTIVITSLLSFLKDQSLSNHHHTVIEAIMSIFRTEGLKLVTFLPQVSLLPCSLRHFDKPQALLDYPSLRSRYYWFNCSSARISSATARYPDWYY
jgi:hypothetical protein